MLVANKKQVPLKSYDLKIKIDSVNQILKNKEEVPQTSNINILTRITDRKIPCVYIHVYHIIKYWEPGPYNSLRHADNRKYFSGLSVMQNRKEAHVLLGDGREKNLETFLLRKRVTLSCLMNSNIVKPEKFDHLQLVYYFTVPLS